MATLFRKNLSAPGLLNTVYKQVSRIDDPRQFRKNPSISLSDHLMSGIAIFGLKFPSLLDFDKKRRDHAIVRNLKNLYHVSNPPSDTYLRERLDEVDPNKLRPVFTKLFALAQRGKVLEDFEFYDGHVLR